MSNQTQKETLLDNINTENTLEEIPFPLLRTITFKPNTVVKFTVNYTKVNQQLKNWTWNKQNN